MSIGVPLNALSSQNHFMIWPGSHSRDLSLTANATPAVVKAG